jgi:hypothetical protein
MCINESNNIYYVYVVLNQQNTNDAISIISTRCYASKQRFQKICPKPASIHLQPVTTGCNNPFGHKGTLRHCIFPHNVEFLKDKLGGVQTNHRAWKS